jgi:hypothetical protein
MATIFDTEKWSTTQAALYIFCDSRTGTADEQVRLLGTRVTAWFTDRAHNVFPIDDDAIYKKFKTFEDRARKTWGNEFASLELHPGIWTWFAAAKCWRSSSKLFWRTFHQWLDGNTANGRLLLVQQRSGSAKTWAKPMVQSDKADIDLGVQPATLVFRPFSKPMVSAVWRTVVYKLGGKASEPKTTTSEMDTAGYTSRSHGCEEAIRALMPAVCRLTRKVRRAHPVDESLPPYEAPKLDQSQLFEFLLQVDGWPKVAKYAVSTRHKSLSKIVGCRRGKPTGTTMASAKRASDTTSVRKRL